MGVMMDGAASMPTGAAMGRARPGGGTRPIWLGGRPSGARFCREGAIEGRTAGGASAEVRFERPGDTTKFSQWPTLVLLSSPTSLIPIPIKTVTDRSTNDAQGVKTNIYDYEILSLSLLKGDWVIDEPINIYLGLLDSGIDQKLKVHMMDPAIGPVSC